MTLIIPTTVTFSSKTKSDNPALLGTDFKAQVKEIIRRINNAHFLTSLAVTLRNINLRGDVKEAFEAKGYVFEVVEGRLSPGQVETIIRFSKSKPQSPSATRKHKMITPALKVKEELYRQAEGKFHKEIERIDKKIKFAEEQGCDEIYAGDITFNDFLFDRYRAKGYPLTPSHNEITQIKDLLTIR
ncbi:hypothetical protein CN918_30980 [Priestia megaterium]|nr:hypothetical protein CN918_30980 [Priestia megaterium]